MKPFNKLDESPGRMSLFANIVAGLTTLGLAGAFFFCSTGCSENSQSTAGAVSAANNQAPANPITNVSQGLEFPQVSEQDSQVPEQETEAAEPYDPGVIQKASDLFEKAKTKSNSTAFGATKWVQDKLGDAADAGNQTADDSWKWATETFESLKEQGLTTADSTSEWLGQDWNNMENWEYKIETLTGSDAELTEQLNKLGKQGWNCFRVDGDRFFFKKPVFSYLRHMPFKDFIKLVPLMNNGDK